MKTRKQSIYMAMVAVMLLLAACSDELGVQGTPTGRFTPKGEMVDVSLDLSVSTLSVGLNTRADVEDTQAERQVNDIWLFEYDYATHDLVAPPTYHTIDTQASLSNMQVRLSDNDGDATVVYVVANTGDETWAADATSEGSGFNSLEGLKAQTIPNPSPIKVESGDDGASLSIPMGGGAGEDDDTLKVYKNEEIKVPVERMFAKLEVHVTLNESEDYSDASMTSLAIDKIPNACTVATTYDGDAWKQPENSKFEVSRMFTVENDDDDNADSSDNTHAYGPFILYVPENLSGNDTIDAIKIIPYIKAVDNASRAEILSKPYYTVYPGSWNSDGTAKSGSGGDDYNVKRNCVYAINITVNLKEEPVTPSANCLIATPGQTIIAFYPYVRDEEMSAELKAEADEAITERYTFTSYLNPSYVGDDATDGKKIKSVKIVWQTEGCIGNNSGGDLVDIDPAPSEEDYAGWEDDAKAKAMTEAERRRKIYVKVSDYGNALIAAYDGEDGTGNILWSWHIWVPEVDPEANAIEYYHYAWDAVNGIDTSTFVPGRLVMNMNLGALVEKPANEDKKYDTDTFGTLYQWGRKDPFPPVKTMAEGQLQNWQPYGFEYQYGDCTFSLALNDFASTTYTVSLDVYDNTGSKIVTKGNTGAINATAGNSVFYTEAPKGTSFDDNGHTYYGNLEMTDDNTVIRSTVQHPTMFIASRAPSSSTIEISTSDYYNGGDWLPDKDDCLWGGGHPGTKEYQVYSTSNNDGFDAYLEDNYGPEKTIFDPCPYGWRVAPGDLWLGFTIDGKNWHYNPGNKVGEEGAETGLDHLDEINLADGETGETILSQHGFNMNMQGWNGALGSATSFFPNQGVRSASGQPFGDLNCGNYHNATADKEINGIRRVDIIHFHSSSAYAGINNGNNVFIKVFVDDTFFYEKALGCPLRCVRDTK